MLLVSGATSTMRILVGTPLAKGRLGHLVQPRQYNRLDRLLSTGLPFAVDNDGFKGFCWPRYRNLLAAALPLGPLFATMPDAVGDCNATIVMTEGYYGMIEDGEGETPWAFVLQDGMEDRDWDYWFGYGHAAFIGGSTAWKLSQAAADLAREAKRRGMWLHMGRVNSFRRTRYAYELGCDSIDGTGVLTAPDIKIPEALAWIARCEGQKLLFDYGGAS